MLRMKLMAFVQWHRSPLWSNSTSWTPINVSFCVGALQLHLALIELLIHFKSPRKYQQKAEKMMLFDLVRMNLQMSHTAYFRKQKISSATWRSSILIIHRRPVSRDTPKCIDPEFRSSDFSCEHKALVINLALDHNIPWFSKRCFSPSRDNSSFEHSDFQRNDK